MRTSPEQPVPIFPLKPTGRFRSSQIASDYTVASCRGDEKRNGSEVLTSYMVKCLIPVQGNWREYNIQIGFVRMQPVFAYFGKPITVMEVARRLAASCLHHC